MEGDKPTKTGTASFDPEQPPANIIARIPTDDKAETILLIIYHPAEVFLVHTICACPS